MTQNDSDQEPIRFRCNRCFHNLRAPAEKRGMILRCPACFIDLTIPAESTRKPVKESDLYGVDKTPIDARELGHRLLASFSCPICRAIIAVDSPSQVGKAIACPDCGAPTIVPAEVYTAFESKISNQNDNVTWKPSENADIYGISDPNDEYYFSGGSNVPGKVFRDDTFAIYCGLCNTMMRANDSQIGQMLTCPDCGRQTKVLKPEKIATEKHQTVKFEGSNQYGTKDPELAAMIAAKVRLVPVVCMLCETRMYAREDEIGNFKTCPDCGTQTKIVDVPEEQRILPTSDGNEYTIKEPEKYSPPRFRVGADYRNVDGSLDLDAEKARRKQANEREEKERKRKGK